MIKRKTILDLRTPQPKRKRLHIPLVAAAGQALIDAASVVQPASPVPDHTSSE